MGLTAELDGHVDARRSAVTPGWLRSEADARALRRHRGPTGATRFRDASRTSASPESPTYVARGIAALAADPKLARYAGQRADQLATSAVAYGVTDVDGSRPDCWRYVVEIEEPELPATEAGYR